MSDLGVNEIADLKHKKFPPTGPLGKNEDPREEIFYAYGLQFHLCPSHPCRNYPF